MGSILRNVPLFEQLQDEELLAIENIALKKTYSVGSTMFREGDQGNAFFIMISGAVKIFTALDNKEKIIAVFREGDSFGELALLDNDTRSASAQAIEESVLMIISRDSFMSLLERNFSITQNILAELSKRLRKTNQDVSDLVFLDAKTRVTKTLINLAKEHGSREENLIRVNINFNSYELGKMAGISEEVSRQVLIHMERKGVISFTDKAFYIDVSNLKK